MDSPRSSVGKLDPPSLNNSLNGGSLKDRNSRRRPSAVKPSLAAELKPLVAPTHSEVFKPFVLESEGKFNEGGESGRKSLDQTRLEKSERPLSAPMVHKLDQEPLEATSNFPRPRASGAPSQDTLVRRLSGLPNGIPATVLKHRESGGSQQNGLAKKEGQGSSTMSEHPESKASTTAARSLATIVGNSKDGIISMGSLALRTILAQAPHPSNVQPDRANSPQVLSKLSKAKKRHAHICQAKLTSEGKLGPMLQRATRRHRPAPMGSSNRVTFYLSMHSLTASDTLQTRIRSYFGGTEQPRFGNKGVLAKRDNYSAVGPLGVSKAGAATLNGRALAPEGAYGRYCLDYGSKAPPKQELKEIGNLPVPEPPKPSGSLPEGIPHHFGDLLIRDKPAFERVQRYLIQPVAPRLPPFKDLAVPTRYSANRERAMDTRVLTQAPETSPFYITEQARLAHDPWVDEKALRRKQNYHIKLNAYVHDKNHGELEGHLFGTAVATGPAL